MRAELGRLLPVLRATKGDLAEDLVVALKNQAHLEIDEGHYDRAELAAQEAVDVGFQRWATSIPRPWPRSWCVPTSINTVAPRTSP